MCNLLFPWPVLCHLLHDPRLLMVPKSPLSLCSSTHSLQQTHPLPTFNHDLVSCHSPISCCSPDLSSKLQVLITNHSLHASTLTSAKYFKLDQPSPNTTLLVYNPFKFTAPHNHRPSPSQNQGILLNTLISMHFTSFLPLNYFLTPST